MNDMMCQPAGKRLLNLYHDLEEQEEELIVQMERIHGIVMINEGCAMREVLEPIDIDQNLLMDIRMQVWKAYFSWKLQAKNLGDVRSIHGQRQQSFEEPKNVEVAEPIQ